jgi:hypothetical protein
MLPSAGVRRQARSRAIVKTLCYRLLMIVITVAVALVVGDLGEAASIGLAANLAKTATYHLRTAVGPDRVGHPGRLTQSALPASVFAVSANSSRV